MKWAKWGLAGWLLSQGCAVADESKPLISGVWQGTLGAAQIRVCFETNNRGYYYREHAPVLRPLIPNEAADLKEAAVEVVALQWRVAHGEPSEPLWVVEQVEQARIKGQVIEVARAHTAPLRLTRLPFTSEGSYCSSNAYLSPLEKYDLVVTKGEWQGFGPQQNYRKIEFGDWQSIELAGKGTAITHINAAYALAADEQAHQAYYEQRREMLEQYGIGEQVFGEQTTEPVLWLPDFISIQTYHWPIGQGARGINIEQRTWDLHSGEEVWLWHWLTGAKAYQSAEYASLPYNEALLPQALSDYMVEHHGLTRTADTTVDEDDEETDRCEPHDRLYFTLALSATGLEFTPHSEEPACRDAYELTFIELEPYLSPEGIAAVASIQGADLENNLEY